MMRRMEKEQEEESLIRDFMGGGGQSIEATTKLVRTVTASVDSLSHSTEERIVGMQVDMQHMQTKLEDQLKELEGGVNAILSALRIGVQPADAPPGAVNDV